MENKSMAPAISVAQANDALRTRVEKLEKQLTDANALIQKIEANLRVIEEQSEYEECVAKDALALIEAYGLVVQE